jgi:hypothetical protein
MAPLSAPQRLPRLGLFARSVTALKEPLAAHVGAWETELNERAQAELERIQAEHLVLVRRRNAAASWIADAAINDEVETFARPLGGRGNPQRVAGAEVWAVDPPVWASVFQKCRVPMVTEAGVAECYLFLGRETFERAMAPLLKRSEKRKMTPAEEADQPFLVEMNSLRLADRHLSITNAAMDLASKAWGSATPENKAKRLERHYIKRFGKGPAKPEE